MIPKVLAYITRRGPAGLAVLVFRYADQPEAPPQVPGGTVEDGEDLIQALWREIEEETGLTGLSLVSQVAKAPFFADWRNEWQERNVFHVKGPVDGASSWIHRVTAGEEDRDRPLICTWQSIETAASQLRWGQGQWLSQLKAYP